MIQHVEETDTQYGYRSDHSMIFFKLSFGGKKMKRRTFLKFSSPLLKDFAYLKEIHEEIKLNIIL